MKKLILCMALLTVAACSGSNNDGINGNSGNNGLDGVNGSDGQNGTNGADGQQGPVGPPGPKGDPGQGEIVKRTFKCDFKRQNVLWNMNNGTGAIYTNNIDFWYYAQEMTSGATFSRAGVDIYCPNGLPTRYSSNNSSEYWAGGTWESDNGANWILLDAPGTCGAASPHQPENVGNWEFLLDKQNYRLTVSYTDGDVNPVKTSFIANCH